MGRGPVNTGWVGGVLPVCCGDGGGPRVAAADDVGDGVGGRRDRIHIHV
jgi:hypothetical protein